MIRYPFTASARAWLRRAIAIRRKLAPGSLDLAASLNSLAGVASQERKLREARDAKELDCPPDFFTEALDD